jgi:hypothetical protein
MNIDIFHPGEVPRPPAGKPHGRHPYSLYMKGLRAVLRQLVNGPEPVEVAVELSMTIYTRRPGNNNSAATTIMNAMEGVVIVDRGQVDTHGCRRRPPDVRGPGVRIVITRAIYTGDYEEPVGPPENV